MEVATFAWKREILASVSQSLDIASHFLASASQFLPSGLEHGSLGRSFSKFKGVFWASSKYAPRSHSTTRYFPRQSNSFNDFLLFKKVWKVVDDFFSDLGRNFTSAEFSNQSTEIFCKSK